MQNMMATLVTALCGALIAVAAVVVLTNAGYMPLNEIQLRNYLLGHPQLVAEMSDAAQREEDARTAAAQAAILKKVGLKAFFDPRLAFVTGPVNAPNTMVEFYDYDCPFCRASLPAVKKAYEQHKGDTRFAFIEFPLDIHGPGAVVAAKASLAARAQPEKFLAFHYLMMGESEPMTEDMVLADAKKAGLDVKKLQADMASPAIAKILEDSRAFGHKVQLIGTPTFIINGVMYPQQMDDATFAAAFKK
ncbi:MAG: thioredoxin domain-containing protein [Alphaproteobacteria bacterium]|nr:thioredoxin domain-containing protein [Alphaproteobacteria bacterium]